MTYVTDITLLIRVLDTIATTLAFAVGSTGRIRCIGVRVVQVRKILPGSKVALFLNLPVRSDICIDYLDNMIATVAVCAVTDRL